MSQDLYATDDLVVLGIDDFDFSVVFSSILAAISDVHEFGLRFIDHAVRSGLKVNRIEKFQRIPSKDAEHPVIATCQKQPVQLRNEQCSLRFLKSGDADHPLASVYVYDLKRTVFQARHEQALAFNIYIHVVETAFDIR